MRWSALTTKTKATVVVAVAAVIWVGGVGSAGALVGSAVTSAGQTTSARQVVADTKTTGPTRSATPTPTPTPTPVVEQSEVTEQSPIAFRKTTVDDPTLAKGQTRLRTAGVAGVLTRTFRVTTTDGVETARVQISETVTRPAIAEVTAVGTYVAPAPVAPAPAPAPVEQAPAPAPQSQTLITPGAFCADAQNGVVAQAANGHSYRCGGKGADANGHLHWNTM